MKSEQQISRDSQQAVERIDRIRKIEPSYDEPLADYIFSTEMGEISCFKDRVRAATISPDHLRHFLGFQGMNSETYYTLSHTLTQLIDREDINQLDVVIDRLVNFVRMCPAFHTLRFADQIQQPEERPDVNDDIPWYFCSPEEVGEARPKDHRVLAHFALPEELDAVAASK